MISSLRNLNSCTKYEAERLMSFCNSAGPLFILGVVGTDLFNSPEVGYLLLLCNYAGLITTGLIFRRYGKAEGKNNINFRETNLFKKAVYNMKMAQKKDGRNFNYLFSDSIRDGVKLMLMIGGYIITFSVIVKLLNITGFTSFIADIFNILSGGYISKEMAAGIINGIFEMTVGCNSLKELPISLYQKTMLAGFILSWGGLSTHTQVISVLEKTDISYLSYFLAKIVHSILTPIYIFLAYPIIIKSDAIETFNIADNWLFNLWFSLFMIIMVISIVSLIAIVNGLAFKNRS
ncbi:MAG: hypothetical protein QME46_06475 [Thermoanaerobacteraceae bacterium]|nr:hypothetical protein [Thermoanaerobacteraceae bacterium]